MVDILRHNCYNNPTISNKDIEIKLGRKIKLKTYVNILQGIFSKFENYKQIVNAGMLDYRGFFATFSHLKPQNSNHQMKNTFDIFS